MFYDEDAPHSGLPIIFPVALPWGVRLSVSLLASQTPVSLRLLVVELDQ